jgi:hypothetical protein
VAFRAVGGKECLAFFGLLTVDLSEYIFGPFGRRQTSQRVLDLFKIKYCSVRIEEAFLRCLGGQIQWHEHALSLGQVTIDRILLSAKIALNWALACPAPMTFRGASCTKLS